MESLFINLPITEIKETENQERLTSCLTVSAVISQLIVSGNTAATSASSVRSNMITLANTLMISCAAHLQ